MNRTIELLCGSVVLASGMLLYTAPTYDLGVPAPKPRIVETRPEPIKYEVLPVDRMMDSAKVSWCDRRKTCLKLSEALYFEARSEGVVGMHAVANVIINRSKKNNRSVYAVIVRPKQFSYLERTTLNITEPEAHRKAKLIAVKAITGTLKDITKGSTHYVAPKRLKRIPSWVKKLEKTVAINDHQFFRG